MKLSLKLYLIVIMSTEIYCHRKEDQDQQTYKHKKPLNYVQ